MSALVWLRRSFFCSYAYWMLAQLEKQVWIVNLFHCNFIDIIPLLLMSLNDTEEKSDHKLIFSLPLFFICLEFFRFFFPFILKFKNKTKQLYQSVARLRSPLIFPGVLRTKDIKWEYFLLSANSGFIWVPYNSIFYNSSLCFLKSFYIIFTYTFYRFAFKVYDLVVFESCALTTAI